ncbi:MAG: hypothetical protein F6K18_15025 [Okeania sp. SIO2C2]|uniref:hypothetical protein n=1 Tax=Okeania sp. SIO2C2 TaxID=2607787 RepID=UPI0013BCDF65|nr:hypothetical protein [Okeania sp. SIO2C2]NEP88030.1 hypothetical protein [Okeania sp. SIO2C2]
MLSWLYPSLIFAIDQELLGKTTPDIDKCIEEFITKFPNSSFAWGCKGWKLGCKNQWQEAIISLEKATHLSDIKSWILLNLGIAYEH